MSVDKQTLKRLDELAMMNDRLEKQLLNTREVLGSAIAWIAQSAGSPLSVSDAKLLLERLHK